VSPTTLLGMTRSFLASPRLASAATVAAAGLGVCAQAIERLIGWPGLISMLVTLVVLVAGSLLARAEEIEWQGLLPVSLLTFVAWVCFSIIWSEYQWVSAAGIAYFLAFSILGVSIALSRDTIQIVRAFGDVFRAVLAVSFIVEIVSGALIDAPLGFLGVQGNLDQFGPLQGIMGSRNQFGLLCLLALVTFSIEFATRSVTRGVAIGSLVLAAAGVALSRSPVIGAILVVVAGAVLAIYLVRRVSPARRAFWQWGILAAVVLIGVVAWLFRARIITFFSANSELTYRLTLWRHMWDLIAVNPLEGWGWVGYWRPEVQPFPLFAIAGGREPSSGLNAYLDVWFQLGLVGAVIFGGLVVLTFTRSWLLAGRQRSIVFAWPALVLVVLLVTSLAESSMLVEYGWLIFVVCTIKAAQQLSWRQAFAAQKKPPDE
jgi:O-antigen ligase